MKKFNKKLIIVSSTILSASLALGVTLPSTLAFKPKMKKNSSVYNPTIVGGLGTSEPFIQPGQQIPLTVIYTPSVTDYKYSDSSNAVMTGFADNFTMPAGAQYLNLNIPSSVTKIDNNAFLYSDTSPKKNLLNKIVRVDLMSGGQVTNLGIKSFSGLNNLREVVFNQKLTSAEYDVFMNCTKLAYIPNFENTKIWSIGRKLFSNTKVSKFIIPKTVTQILSWSYAENKNLKRVYIESNILRILNGRVFENNVLEHFYLGNSLSNYYGKDNFKSKNTDGYKFVTRWNVNLPDEYNTVESFTSSGIRQENGDPYTTLEKEPLKLSFDSERFLLDNPTATNLDQLKTAFDGLSIHEKYKYIKHNSTIPGLEPVDFLRGATAAIEAGQLKINFVLNSLYQTDSTWVAFDNNLLQGNDTKLITTINSTVLDATAYQFSKRSDLIAALETDITKWNLPATTNKAITEAEYPTLSKLGIQIENIYDATVLNMVKTEDATLNKVSFDLSLENIILNGSNSAGATSPKISFTALFDKDQIVDNSTKFESLSTTNNTWNLTQYEATASNVDSFKLELKNEIDAWNLNNQTSVSFDTTKILKELKVNVANIQTNSKLSSVETFNEKNKTLTIDLTLSNALQNGATKPLKLTYVVLFGAPSIATFSTSQTSSTFDLSSQMNSSDIEAFKTKLENEAKAWTPTTADLTNSEILNNLFKINITNPNSDSLLTATVTQKPNNNVLSVRLTLSNAYTIDNLKKPLTLDFSIIYNNNTIQIPTFGTTLTNNVIDLKTDPNKFLSASSINEFNSKISTEVQNWNTNHLTNWQNNDVFKLIGLNINQADTYTMSYDLSNNTTSKELKLKLTISNPNATPEYKELNQFFTFQYGDSVDTLFKTSLINNTYTSAELTTDKLDAYKAELTKQVNDWNSNNVSNFAGSSILESLGLSIERMQQNSTIAISTYEYDQTANILRFNLTLDKANNPISSTPAILEFNVLFVAPTITVDTSTTFTTSKPNNVLDLTSHSVKTVQQFKDALNLEIENWNKSKDLNFANSSILKELGLSITNPTSNMSLAAPVYVDNIASNSSLNVTLKLEHVKVNEVENQSIDFNFTVWFKKVADTTFTSPFANSIKNIPSKWNINNMNDFENALNSEITEWNKTKDASFANSTILKWFGISVSNLDANSQLKATYTESVATSSLGIKLSLENSNVNGSPTTLSLNFTILFSPVIETPTFDSTLENNTVNLVTENFSNSEAYLDKLNSEIIRWNHKAVKDFEGCPILKSLKLQLPSVTNTKLKITSYTFDKDVSRLIFVLGLENNENNLLTAPIQFNIQFGIMENVNNSSSNSSLQIGVGAVVGILLFIVLILIIVFVTHKKKHEI